ncbi:MAG: hypothetical protein QOH64_2693 [Acidimicrobiaceae bacterium]
MAASAVMGMVKRAAAVADRLRPPPRGVVILAYHRIGGGSGLEIDVPSELFDAQMAALAASKRVVSLDHAVDLLASDEPHSGDDPVVVTFDDGTADLAEHALPILVRHRVPATLYLATKFVEDQEPFPSEGRSLSWDALADMVSTGLVTIGSHTHSHAVLSHLPTAQVEDELDRSIELIGERLGVVAAHFAHPKAVAASPEGEAAIRARFRSAARSGMRPNPFTATDVHQLARSPIQTADGLRWFHRKVGGGMALEGALREVLDRRRYAGAVS